MPMMTKLLRPSKQSYPPALFLLVVAMVKAMSVHTSPLPGQSIANREHAFSSDKLPRPTSTEGTWTNRRSVSRSGRTSGQSTASNTSRSTDQHFATGQETEGNSATGNDSPSPTPETIAARERRGQQDWLPHPSRASVHRRASGQQRTATPPTEGASGHESPHTENSSRRRAESSSSGGSCMVSWDGTSPTSDTWSSVTSTSSEGLQSSQSVTSGDVTLLGNSCHLKTCFCSIRDSNSNNSSSNNDHDLTWPDDDVGVDASTDTTTDTDYVLTVHANGDVLDDTDIDQFLASGRLWIIKTSYRRQLRINITDRGLVGKRAYKTFSKVIYSISFSIMLVGFVTNVIALKVFGGLPANVTNTYVTYLIRFDLVYLTCLVAHSVTSEAFCAHVHSTVLMYLFLAGKFAAFCLRQAIVSSTAFMNLDRYFRVASPFRKLQFRFLRRPRALVTIVLIVIVLVNGHILLKRQVYVGVVAGTNQTVSYIAHTQSYLDNRLLVDSLSIASTCLFQHVPLIAMTVANVALVISLHRYSKSVSAACSPFVVETSSATANNEPSASERAGGARQRRGDRVPPPAKPRSFFQLEKRMSVTVITYSFLFLVLALPLALGPLLQQFFPSFNVFQREHYFVLLYCKVTYLLDIISSSMNFFVFFIKGGAFRFAVRKLMRRLAHAAKTKVSCRKGTRWKIGQTGDDDTGIALKVISEDLWFRS